MERIFCLRNALTSVESKLWRVLDVLSNFFKVKCFALLPSPSAGSCRWYDTPIPGIVVLADEVGNEFVRYSFERLPLGVDCCWAGTTTCIFYFIQYQYRVESWSTMHSNTINLIGISLFLIYANSTCSRLLSHPLSFPFSFININTPYLPISLF